MGALEDKFWASFCEAVALPDDLRGGAADPRQVMAGVAERIAGSPAAHWREIFARVECCASVVTGLEAALGDPHFRPLVAGARTALGSSAIPALPMPFASLQAGAAETKAAPALAEANEAFGFPPARAQGG